MKRDLAIKQLKAIEKHIKKKKTDDMLLAADWNSKYKILISTILSAMTTDEITIKYSLILYKKYPSIKLLSKARISDVIKIIRPINYHKTKARHIIETSKIITNKGFPKTRKNLTELPGVGRKVANVYLAVAHNLDVIGVDTHVAFISQQLGWTKNKNPHKIELDLERLFPKTYWRSLNYILVRFGRTYKSRKKQIEILKDIL